MGRTRGSYEVDDKARTFSAIEIEEFLQRADHLDVAELFKQTVGEHAYFQFLRSRYRRAVPLTSALKALARLPVTTAFTTNYDKLLESSLRAGGTTDPAVVVYPQQLNHIGSQEAKVVKTHGDHRSP